MSVILRERYEWFRPRPAVPGPVRVCRLRIRGPDAGKRSSEWPLRTLGQGILDAKKWIIEQRAVIVGRVDHLDERPSPSGPVDAADVLIQRLDDLYDQRPNAIPNLIATLQEVSPVLAGSELGALADAACDRLDEIERADLDPAAANFDALGATGSLRIAVAKAL